MLEQLERANLFIVSRDTQRRWYRYHALFAEALRQRLEQTLALQNEGQRQRECSVSFLSIWYVLAMSIVIRWTLQREEDRRKGEIYERNDWIYWPWQYGKRGTGAPTQR